MNTSSGGVSGARSKRGGDRAGEQAVHDRRVGDGLQEVVDGDPLVVPLDELAGLLEAPVAGDRAGRVGGEPAEDRVVELEEGQVQLGDDEVLVVAAVADLRLLVLPWQVVADQGLLSRRAGG
jgi:hypothetical protein